MPTSNGEFVTFTSMNQTIQLLFDYAENSITIRMMPFENRERIIEMVFLASNESNVATFILKIDYQLQFI